MFKYEQNNSLLADYRYFGPNFFRINFLAILSTDLKLPYILLFYTHLDFFKNITWRLFVLFGAKSASNESKNVWKNDFFRHRSLNFILNLSEL